MTLIKENGDDHILFDHKFDCISFTGTSIPNRDNIFVYVAQLSFYNQDDYTNQAESRQLFTFQFENSFTAQRIFETLNEKTPSFRKHVEKYPVI